jgi:Ca2+-binding RTX toxin-like protein
MAGHESVTLGSGAATVIGAGGDTIAAGTSTAAFIDAHLGSMAIQIGSSGSDTIYARTDIADRNSGAGGNTITAAAGGSASADVILARGDRIDLSGGTGNATINAIAGDGAVTLGSGAATVFGGAGDTISIGNSTASFVDARSGGMSIEIGSTGSDTIYALADANDPSSGAGHDTITAYSGGTASANVILAGGDQVDLTGGFGSATINALAGNDSVKLGAGAATVFAAQGDTVTAGTGSSMIVVGSGAVSVSLPGGHGAATIGDVGIFGSDTVTGFTPGQDKIFFSGQDDSPGGSRDQVIAAQSHPTIGSTVLSFPDGTTMTLVGIASVDQTFFK